MRTLTIELPGRSYPIRIGEGLLASPAAFDDVRGRKCFVVTDQNVAGRYLAAVRNQLGVEEKQCLVLPAGEGQKTFDNAGSVAGWLLDAGLHRDGLVVALGGGVIGDLTGFAASIVHRGVDFLQVPTTLLSQVDSSVGGKTGVNHAKGKNLIGAFHQPVAVIADLATLKTLPKRELLAGLAEVIKYGMLGDKAFFGRLERQCDALLALDRETLASTVEACCRMKARIVGADEREAGARALLNLGHTFGHAIEAHVNFEGWLHGEAVAVGLCMAADLSRRLGWLPAEDAARCEALVQRTGLPTRPPQGLTPARFLELMGHDKKVKAGKLRLVLMKSLGQAVITGDADPALLMQTLEHFTSNP